MTPSRIAALLLSVLVSASAVEPADGPVGFRRDIAPILVRNCVGCHNDKKAADGLNLSTFLKLKQGGKASGKDILVPGDPKASELYLSLLADASPRMPYKQLPLDPAQIEKVERWIKAGATFDGPDPAVSIASLVDPLADLPRVAVRSKLAEPVTSLAASPDGKTFAAAVGRDAVLIDRATGKEIAKLGPHDGPLHYVSFSRDGGGLIAAGGRAGMFGSIVVWDLGSRTKRRETRGHADAILSADLTRDGRILVTGSYDRMVKLWDVETLREIRTLVEHTDSVHAVAASPDGRLVASGGADRTVKLWRVADGKRLVSLAESGGEVYALAFSNDGSAVHAGGVDRSIRSWLIKGEAVSSGRSTFAHEAPILRLTEVGGRLYSSSEDRSIRSWEIGTLQPVSAWQGQSDWVYALTAAGKNLAVGRHDGTAEILDAVNGKSIATLRRPAPPRPSESAAAPSKPELIRPATLNPPSPRGATRGRKVRVTLTGQAVGQTIRVLIPEPGLTAEIVRSEKPETNRLDVDLTVAPDARPGVHRIGVRTPHGIPAFQSFVVESAPEVAEKEPNDRSAEAAVATVPSTLIGAIGRPGDVDLFRIRASKGRAIVVSTRAKALGSDLLTLLTVSDPSGKTVATARTDGDLADPVLSFTASVDGEYLLSVTDADFGGSGNHFYRLNIGETPDVDSVFPLGVERGRSRELTLRGVNLGKNPVNVSAPESTPAGGILPLPIESARFRAVAAADGPQSIEKESGDDLASAGTLAVPGGVSARIDRPGDVDFHRFEAKRGQPLIVEVLGRRLGSPIDSALEIVDARGQVVPRALLRPIDQTTVAFRDHGSLSRGIRLTTWDHLAVGDYILAGREVLRISDLPRNPDDDAIFWGLGQPRQNPGERMGLFETTPEQHPMGQPLYKVEIHPPGRKFAGGGIPPVTIHYRNDDGGPGFGKDSRLTFDPPADGTYYARVEDALGQGGEDRGYHLVVRRPRPDFTLAASIENPNIPRGGSSVLGVSIGRVDGFNGAVEIRVEGLPPGITATSTRIEPDAFAADILISADEQAPPFSTANWTLRATAVDSSAGIPDKTLDPGGPSSGWITVTPSADVKITPSTRAVVLKPGGRVELTFKVDRSAAFAGRVPIDVRNLPAGVHVLNVGLNGILVTEKQIERSVTLQAEPWVAPLERSFFAVGRVEAAGVFTGSPPVNLIIRP